jgi:hypothetical protein
VYIETAASIGLTLSHTYAREVRVGSSLAVAENERHRGTGAPHNTTQHDPGTSPVIETFGTNPTALDGENRGVRTRMCSPIGSRGR